MDYASLPAMSDESELRLYVACARDFGERSSCRQFLAALEECGSDWLPERFGSAEPLRRRFREEGATGACEAWNTPPRPGSAGGDLLYRSSNTLKARGWVYWRRGPRHDVNFVNIAVPAKSPELVIATTLVKLGKWFIRDLGGVFGRVCHSADFDAQHKQRTPGGYQYVGQRLSEGLPGLYWANMFGAELVRLIGERRFEQCPASNKEQTADGTWILFSSASPIDYASDHTQDLRAAMRQTIGAEFFFDINAPNVKPTPIPFQRSAITRLGAQR